MRNCRAHTQGNSISSEHSKDRMENAATRVYPAQRCCVLKGGGNKSTKQSDSSLVDGAVKGAGSPLDRASRGALLGGSGL